MWILLAPGNGAFSLQETQSVFILSTGSHIQDRGKRCLDQLGGSGNFTMLVIGDPELI